MHLISGTPNASSASPATLTSAPTASTTETTKPSAPPAFWTDSPPNAWGVRRPSKRITSPRWTDNGTQSASSAPHAGIRFPEETFSNTKVDPIARTTTML